MACVADTFRRAANYRSCTLEPWMDVEPGRELGNASPGRVTSDLEKKYQICSYWGWAFRLQLQMFLRLQPALLGKELDAHEDIDTFTPGNFETNALCGCHWWTKWFGGWTYPTRLGEFEASAELLSNDVEEGRSAGENSMQGG
ncbi:hypothetical protein N7527_008540 [Penicillium freii]|nr:hypothetical protein N7527_008540 [Penicillium freii]